MKAEGAAEADAQVEEKVSAASCKFTVSMPDVLQAHAVVLGLLGSLLHTHAVALQRA